MAMSDEVRQRLEVEVDIGGQYSNSWKFVSKFVNEKFAQLLEAFENTHATDIDTLVAIKNQHNVLQGIQNEFLSYIETAKMAANALSEDE